MVVVSEEDVQARRTRFLFAASLVGLVLYLVLDAAVQALPPHYSPVSQAESDLAIGPFGYVMTLNFINRGAFSLCFLFALTLTANTGDVMRRRFRRGGYLFAVWSVGALLLAAFPADVPATPITWHGVIHLAVAVTSFLGGAFGAVYLSLGMEWNRHLSRVRGSVLPIAYAAVVLCLVDLLGGFLVPGAFAHYGGLVERAFLASILLWMGWVSVAMLRGPAQAKPAPWIGGGPLSSRLEAVI
ncbi:MAG: DUF998 domain-containing protein [Nitrososphaerota archaeon]|nr:DUF998 domain-containing protein [Nitrososphaerota archaeon]MDG6918179.1 DUF998 domain-containing protein [Nitrososphaerota archaeon]